MREICAKGTNLLEIGILQENPNLLPNSSSLPSKPGPVCLIYGGFFQVKDTPLVDMQIVKRGCCPFCCKSKLAGNES